jgi:hypothetical protein
MTHSTKGQRPSKATDDPVSLAPCRDCHAGVNEPCVEGPWGGVRKPVVHVSRLRSSAAQPFGPKCPAGNAC